MSFENSISIIAALDDIIAKDVRVMGVNIDRRLVGETPRDTGSAKASWLVSINQPNNSVVNTEGGAGIQQALTQGAATANSYESGQTMYIQNNQPYIEGLNAGNSALAPSMYVDKIIQEESNRGN